MPRQKKPLLTCLNVAVANGIGTTINVEEYNNIAIQLGIPTGSTLVVKAMASNSEEAPNFAAAQSLDNHFDYIQLIDLEDGSTIDGDTGIPVTASLEFRNLVVNTANIKWINFVVSGFTAGSATVKVLPVDNS